MFDRYSNLGSKLGAVTMIAGLIFLSALVTPSLIAKSAAATSLLAKNESTQVVHSGIVKTHTTNAPIQGGDVLAAVGSGQVKEFNRTGALVQTLDTTTGSTYTTGMCFDASHNLYVTTFSSGILSKFDSAGNLANASFASGLQQDPESCIVDASGNIYVGDADSTAYIYKFDPSGKQLANFTVSERSRGTDWIDLASDQCTMHYTSESGAIHRFNVCTNTQMPDFSNSTFGGLINTPCYAHRITSDGGELVACSSEVDRVASNGTVVQRYPEPAGGASELFALNVDPDGTTFWTGDLGTGMIYHIDIATGALLASFGSAPNTALAGLAVLGERTVSSPPDVTVIKHIVGGTATLANITLMIDGNAVANNTATTVNANQTHTITESYNPTSLASQYTATFAGDCAPSGVISASSAKVGAHLTCTITDTFTNSTTHIHKVLVCSDYTSKNINNTIVPLNSKIMCKSSDNQPGINGVKYWITGPNGVVFTSKLMKYTPGNTIMFKFVDNSTGSWRVDVGYYYVNGHKVTQKCDLFDIFTAARIG
ncbi:MAG: hypothetical protein ABI361_09075 [Nitrososphaera sp.]|jgi:streptogramin lyase/uncharacterized protein YejL (UPF0352 family)